MNLTKELGTTIQWYMDGTLSCERYICGEKKFFERIRAEKKLFTDQPSRLVLDIGCGDKGTRLVNQFAEEFPRTNVFYLDCAHLLERYDLDIAYDTGLPIHINLQKPYKISANAAKMPFQDNYFDLAFIDITCEGITRQKMIDSKVSPYNCIRETARVLKSKGKLIFAYGKQHPSTRKTDEITLANLNELGFGSLEHILRVIVFPQSYRDLYSATKE